MTKSLSLLGGGRGGGVAYEQQKVLSGRRLEVCHQHAPLVGFWCGPPSILETASFLFSHMAERE